MPDQFIYCPCPKCGNKTKFHTEEPPFVGAITMCLNCHSLVCFDLDENYKWFLIEVPESSYEHAKDTHPEMYRIFENMKTVLKQIALQNKEKNN